MSCTDGLSRFRLADSEDRALSRQLAFAGHHDVELCIRAVNDDAGRADVSLSR